MGNESGKIDGSTNDACWANAYWAPIDQLWVGTATSNPNNYSGRYKVSWDDSLVYIIMEITDDIFHDTHANPLQNYWDDDCIEIFIDEDKSGGNHQFNYNAFAYHIAIDNQTVDIGEKSADGTDNFVLLNDHIKSQWQRQQTAWES